MSFPSLHFPEAHLGASCWRWGAVVGPDAIPFAPLLRQVANSDWLVALRHCAVAGLPPRDLAGAGLSTRTLPLRHGKASLRCARSSSTLPPSPNPTSRGESCTSSTLLRAASTSGGAWRQFSLRIFVLDLAALCGQVGCDTSV